MTDTGSNVRLDRDGRWALEAWNPHGWTRSEIALTEVESPVPSGFEADRLEAYKRVLHEKIDAVESDGNIAYLDTNDGPLRATTSGSNLVRPDSGRPIPATVLSTFPSLHSKPSPESRSERRVFWDGKTVVARPVSATNRLVLHGYEDTYSGSLAASEAVDDYPIEKLPLSMNVTVVPLLTGDECPVIPVFERTAVVASYPKHHMTVAGGLDSLERHPVDEGWRELLEEIRIAPAEDRSAYETRGLLSSATASTLRPGTVQGQPMYTVARETGQQVLYTSEAPLVVIGVVRNLDNSRPELCGVLDTDVPAELVEENRPRNIEHERIEFVEFTATNLATFLTTREEVPPVHRGAFVLAGEFAFGGFLDEFTTEVAPGAIANDIGEVLID
jgi:hypothetical protein